MGAVSADNRYAFAARPAPEPIADPSLRSTFSGHLASSVRETHLTNNPLPPNVLPMLKKNLAKSSETSERLGASLRRRRKALGLTMQQVAERAGLSIGFISQVERGLATPSLASLTTLCETLETHISSFLQQPAGTREITRQESRGAYSIPGADATYERVSSRFSDSKLHSVIVHEPPGHRMEPVSHRGEEMFYILRGALTVDVEGERRILQEGDSIHFDSRRVHSAWNHTDQVTSILWCGTMNIFGDSPSAVLDAAPTDQAGGAQGRSRKT